MRQVRWALEAACAPHRKTPPLTRAWSTVAVRAARHVRPCPATLARTPCPAVLVADWHAHLLTNEVIGFCAGSLAETPRRGVRISRAFPCKSLVAGMDNVEMDPASELEVRNQIHDESLQVVGWYHSHPYFQPDPSLVDIHNQATYQQLFRDDDVRDEPFVGLIVGMTAGAAHRTRGRRSLTTSAQERSCGHGEAPSPASPPGTYDPRLPDAQSIINAFHLPRSTGGPNEPRLVRIRVTDVPHNAGDLAPLEHALVRFPRPPLPPAPAPLPSERTWVATRAGMRRARGGTGGRDRRVCRVAGPDAPGRTMEA